MVFIHGLRGHCRKTLTKDDFFWPADALPGTIPHTRVIMVGYDANVVVFGKAVYLLTFSGTQNRLLSP